MLLLAHAAAALLMAGALWYVQLVHYPRLAGLPAAQLAARAARNIRETSLLLGPLMLAEAACAAALLLVWAARAAYPTWTVAAGALVPALLAWQSGVALSASRL